MAEDNDMKEKANRLFELLSGKDMSVEAKTEVAGVIKENPNILISPEFMEKMAVNDMNKCPKEGYQEYIKQSLDLLKTSCQVLDNLHAMHKEGCLEAVKGGKTPVQYLLDEGRLSNGETLGTQSLKNIVYLRAMKHDANYENKEAIDTLQYESGYLLEKIYAKDEYGANSNCRNALGQKASDLIAIDQQEEKQDDKTRLNVEDLQKRGSQKTMGLAEDKSAEKEPQKPLSREDLEVGAYRGTLTAEQADQLKKLQNKKEADINENMGDVKKPQERKSKDKFTDGDVVKYMYEEWLLAGASWLLNTLEDKALGIIDNACEIATANSVARKRQKAKIREDRLKNAHRRVSDFGDLFVATNNGKTEAYAHKKAKFASIFEDLKANLHNPNPNWRHQHDPQFIANLQKNTNAQEFLEGAPKKLDAQIKLLETTDKLAMLMTRLEMTDEFMRSSRAWNKRGKEKNQNELKVDFDKRSLAKQKMLLRAVSVISEDTRLLAEFAYESVVNPKLSKEEFIQQQVNKEVNDWLADKATTVSKLLERQEKEIQDDKFAGCGKGAPDKGIKKNISKLEKDVEEMSDKGNVFNQSEFAYEGSKKRVDVMCGLYDEAIAQNTPGICDKYMELNQINQDALNAMRAKNITRKKALSAMKSRLAICDLNVSSKLAGYKQAATRG